MEVFINSTFEQSVKGFRLMKLEENGSFRDIVSVDSIDSQLYDFFSEDLFSFLICDLASDGPMSSARCLGIRGMTGMFNNGKRGVIDFGLTCSAGEWSVLDEFLVCYLQNRSALEEALFQAVSVDQNGDYSFRKDEFFNALKASSAENSIPDAFLPRHQKMLRHPPYFVCVCSSSKERAAQYLSGLYHCKIKEKLLLDQTEIENF